MPFHPSASATTRRRTSSQQAYPCRASVRERLGHPGAVTANDELDRHAEGGIDGVHAHRLDQDLVAEPALQGALHQHLGRRRQHVTVGEHELEQATAEFWAHHALARAGEQHLRDQIAEVIGLVAVRRAAAIVESKRKVHVNHRQIPVTRVCVTDAMSGVPLAQIAWLSISNSGWPLLVMRTADVTYCAVTHGPFAVGGGGSVHRPRCYTGGERHGRHAAHQHPWIGRGRRGLARMGTGHGGADVKQKAGHGDALRDSLRDGEGADIDRHRRTYQGDRRALAVLNIDAGVVDDRGWRRSGFSA